MRKKNGNYIDALLAYSEIPGAKATENIHKLFNGTLDTTNIQERISYYNKQKEKWNAIFSQLQDYLSKNVGFIVYDFSNIEDSIDMERNKVDFRITPGIKCVLNEAAVKVWATVMKEWYAIYYDKNNDIWTKTVSKYHFDGGCSSSPFFCFAYSCYVSVGLFDDDDYPIETTKIDIGFSVGLYGNYPDNVNMIMAKTQSRLLSEAKYTRINFYNINFDDLNNGMKVKIIDIKSRGWDNWAKNPLGIYEISEFQQKVLAQKN